MKYEIISSIISLIATIAVTLLSWWLCDCPKIQSGAEMFLLMLIEITLYGYFKFECLRKDE